MRYALIIGAMKSGTTSLYEYLVCHPAIASCREKEPNFFASDHNWPKGWAWYEGLWDFKPEHEIALDGSTHYTKQPEFPNAAERIASTGREFKFIYLMRHPLERIESHLTHGAAKGWLEPGKPIQEYPHALAFSRYATQLSAYTEHFDRDDILLLCTDQLRKAPQDVVARVFDFLDLHPCEVDTDVRHNTSRHLLGGAKWKRMLGAVLPGKKAKPAVERARLTRADRQWVAEQLRDDLARLEDEFGFDTSIWALP